MVGVKLVEQNGAVARLVMADGAHHPSQHKTFLVLVGGFLNLHVLDRISYYFIHTVHVILILTSFLL
jgi:hypothetical protein